MRILVLGSGIVGVAAAYYLARDGHEVAVVDRQSGPGLETSFANAGQMSPGYSAPWAAPGIPVKAVKWLLMKYRPLVLWPRADGSLALWLAQMLANCTESAYRVNKERMVRLAEYSRDCLRDLRRETGIAYDDRQLGTLQLFRSQKQLDHVGADTAVLDDSGVAYEVLDPAGCIAVEPALAAVRSRFVGGLRLPGDETGDAYLFCQRLAEMAAALGVRFHFGTTITALRPEAGRIAAVATDKGDLTAELYVIAMGSYAPLLLRRIGIDVPVYPVKGYSITVPLLEPAAAPVSTVMDETYKVAITRLGERIRVGGTAELAGYSTRLRQPRRATLEHSLVDLFPRGGDLAEASFWTGLRPMTPDGTPIIGRTAYSNLYTNTGHGTLGWTMACGSGRLLADIIGERAPAIEHRHLTMDRYRA